MATFGLVRGLNTLGLGAGSLLYLDPTSPGNVQITRPDSPDFTVVVGHVLRDNSNTGVIFVHPETRPRVLELSDVEFATPTVQGEFLRWDTANARFQLFNNADDYAPGATLNWEAPAPTTFTEALDRLAVRALTAGATGPVE